MSQNSRQNLRYAIAKLIELLATLLLVSFFTFAAFSIIPGDAAQIMLGPDASPSQVEALRMQLGLDRPVVLQYLSWLGGALTGNLGNSVAYHVPVISLITQRLPVTLGMSVMALCLVIVISYPLAVISARRPGHT